MRGCGGVLRRGLAIRRVAPFASVIPAGQPAPASTTPSTPPKSGHEPDAGRGEMREGLAPLRIASLE